MMNFIKNPIVTAVTGLVVGTGFGYWLRGTLDKRAAAKGSQPQQAAK
jgi:ATP-dependent protease ClpP protease subunit